jgi:hypothetical protein
MFELTKLLMMMVDFRTRNEERQGFLNEISNLQPPELCPSCPSFSPDKSGAKELYLGNAELLCLGKPVLF